MIIILVEGVITFIIVASLFYVAPGVLASVRTSAPLVCSVAGGGCASVDAALNSSAAQIGTTTAGGLNLSSITLIMLGIGLMIGGFMLVRGYR